MCRPSTDRSKYCKRSLLEFLFLTCNSWKVYLGPTFSRSQQILVAMASSLGFPVSIPRADKPVGAASPARPAKGGDWDARPQKLFPQGLQRGRPDLDDPAGPPRGHFLRQFQRRNP